MYDNLVGLAFANAYTGIVTTAVELTEDIYRVLPAPEGFETWYFEHTNSDGALWIATGGRHPERIISWLHSAERTFECTTMLAMVIRNGASVPANDAYMFAIPRSALDRDGVHRLASFGCYTIFHPHADEFRLIVPELDQWIAIRRSLDGVPAEFIELAQKNTITSGDLKQSPSKPGSYDPIAAQVREVMDQMTRLTTTAVEQLTQTWERAWPPVPGDIQGLESEISEEEEHLQAALANGLAISADRDRVLANVDRYAQILTKTRRIASDLEQRLIQVDPTPRKRATHEQVATPMMLRAIERYTSDLALRLNVSGYTFVPVIGEQFAVRIDLFPDLWEAEERVHELSAAVSEIPAETRLRLGALPMLAREVAWLMDDELTRIVHCLKDLRHAGDRWSQKILPPPPAKTDNWNRHERLVTQIARELAADLIATAAAGPQYVFSMARFAVGTLSQSELTGLRAPQRLQFRDRISACLALLHARNISITFTSLYLPTTEAVLPGELLALMSDIVPTNPDFQNVDEITTLLCGGYVVDARPLEILATLWRAVAARACYVNEAAALMSVAASRLDQ